MKFITDRFEKGAKIVLFVLAGALPLWVIPTANIGIDLGREISFGILVLLAFALWLLHVLSAGEMRYQRSPLLWAGLGTLAVFCAAALASKAPLVSVLFADAGAEKLSSLAMMLVLAGVAGAVLRRREEAGTLLFILIFSGAVSAVLTFFQLAAHISIFKYLNIANGMDANVIGTINGLALFYAALLAAAAGLLTVASGPATLHARYQGVVTSGNPNNTPMAPPPLQFWRVRNTRVFMIPGAGANGANVAVPPVGVSAVVPITVHRRTATAATTKLATPSHGTWRPRHQRHAQANATTGSTQLT